VCGWPCKYDLKDGIDIPNECLFEHVVPNMRHQFRLQVCKILGKALLYIALKDQDHNDPSYIPVPTNTASQICCAYEELGYEEPQPTTRWYRLVEILEVAE
jgi:hypothetical protein